MLTFTRLDKLFAESGRLNACFQAGSEHSIEQRALSKGAELLCTNGTTQREIFCHNAETMS